MTARARWVGAIVGLLVFNVLATGVLIAAAHHGASRVIPSYYEQAVRYDDVLAQAARDAALGWRVEATLGSEVVVRVHDRTGTPLDGARVRVSGMARASGVQLDGALAGAGDGEYRAPLAHGRGWHDLTIAVERGADAYVGRVAIEAR